MSKKRVHEIAKEHGLSSKELLEKLQAAGVEAKAASSSVEESAALKAFGRRRTRGLQRRAGRRREGRTHSAGRQRPAAASQARGCRSPAGARRPPRRHPHPRRQQPRRPDAGVPPTPVDGVTASGERVRPTRDSRTGERTPGDVGPGGRRRVVIDSQASRRQQGGPSNQPQRRPRRGRRRRGTYDETIAPIDTAAMEATDLIRVNSGSTVKDVAEYLGVPVPGDHQEADDARRDGDAHADALRRRDPGARRRVRQADRDRPRRRRRRGRAGVRGRRGGPDRAPAGGHDHGPRRPRQDLAAGRDPRDRGRRPARPAASPSTSAPTRCTTPARRSRSSTRPATRRSRRCAPAARA